ncbi:hypothetical protein SO802_034468 [Lithocarpus litseifolius]|uniref:Uncharacterized protein n=1 Tax=Lithocarpus litseifolius TaxID=425828 RepID=A0AAW2BHN9_9ROSI
MAKRMLVWRRYLRIKNVNYLLGSIGVFLAFDARSSSDASSREGMGKLIMMEK